MTSGREKFHGKSTLFRATIPELLQLRPGESTKMIFWELPVRDFYLLDVFPVSQLTVS